MDSNYASLSFLVSNETNVTLGKRSSVTGEWEIWEYKIGLVVNLCRVSAETRSPHTVR